MSKMRHKKAGGGRTGLVAAGNPDVLKEAEGKEDYAKGDEKKHGGKVKRASGGRAGSPRLVQFMAGGAVKPRMDRVARKSGGRVGSDRSPMSSAHRTTSAETTPKTQEGGMSD